ncbi:MAG: YihA family ribosome biogenesis GTP-binding protein [bacterium]|nr:YihA family ribosome biogenesis GTP-binding protein [bacterium]
MKIESTRFELSAFREEDEPKSQYPQVVFLGRSNVGKSSLINRLLGVNGLARTSSRPGRTQSINFYRINETFHFVDLPGYGYAKVPEAVRRSWGPMVEGFLERRSAQIVLGILVVDARHEPSPLDVTMRDWLEPRNLPYAVAATKSDRMKSSDRQRASKKLASLCGEGAVAAPLVVSSKTGTGIRELWRYLDRALESGVAVRG